MKKIVAAAAVAFSLVLWSAAAFAQSIGFNTSIAATSGSSTRAQVTGAKSSYPFVLIIPATGTSQEIFYALGDVTVTATDPGSKSLPSGGICLALGSSTYIAAITSTGSAAVRISQISTCTIFSGGSGGGGSGGGGTSSAFNSTFPLTGTAIGVSDGTNMVALQETANALWGIIRDAAGNVRGANVNASNQLNVIEANSSAILTAIEGPIPTQAPTVSVGGVGIIDSGGTNVASVKAASTAPATTDKSVVVALNPNAGVPAQISQYPFGATPITASATGTTGATTATLAGTTGATTYICGYSIRANATAATTVTNTITGVITATLSSIMWVAPAASGLGVDEQIFSPCIPASGTNQAIAIVSGAPGSGGNVSSKGWGYQL